MSDGQKKHVLGQKIKVKIDDSSMQAKNSKICEYARRPSIKKCKILLLPKLIFFKGLSWRNCINFLDNIMQ